MLDLYATDKRKAFVALANMIPFHTLCASYEMAFLLLEHCEFTALGGSGANAEVVRTRTNAYTQTLHSGQQVSDSKFRLRTALDAGVTDNTTSRHCRNVGEASGNSNQATAVTAGVSVCCVLCV